MRSYNALSYEETSCLRRLRERFTLNISFLATVPFLKLALFFEKYKNAFVEKRQEATLRQKEFLFLVSLSLLSSLFVATIGLHYALQSLVVPKLGSPLGAYGHTLNGCCKLNYCTQLLTIIIEKRRAKKTQPCRKIQTALVAVKYLRDLIFIVTQGDAMVNSFASSNKRITLKAVTRLHNRLSRSALV